MSGRRVFFNSIKKTFFASSVLLVPVSVWASNYDCDISGGFPMTFSGCRQGYYYENLPVSNPASITPSNVGKCLLCPSGQTCAGGFAAPSVCPSGYTDETGIGSNGQYTACYTSGTTSCATYVQSFASQGYELSDMNATGVLYGNASNPSSVACKIYREYDNSGNTACIPNRGVCDVTGYSCPSGYVSVRTNSSFLSDYANSSFSSNWTSAINPNGYIESHVSSSTNRNGLANGEFDIGTNFGIIRGRSFCSSYQSVSTGGSPEAASGKYCWCKTTAYMTSGQFYPAESDWAYSFNNSYSTQAACENSCADNCAAQLGTPTSSSQTLQTVLLANQHSYECRLSTYTVHYNLNNGGTRSDATWNVGTAYQVTDPTARSGWTFGGWNITGMDNSTHYYGGNSSTTSSTNATSLTPISIAFRWFKNLRATSGTVTFSAIWYKSCPRGTYFDDTNDTCTTCPGNGKFCSGTAGVDGNGNQGLSDCPSGYTSDSGAISSYMCYKTGGPYYTTCASANSIATQSNSGGAAYANASNPSNVPCKKYYDYNNSNPTCFPEPGVCDITGLSCDTGYSQGTITGFLDSYVVNVTPSAQPKGFELDGTTDFFSSGANSARNGLANGEFEVYFPYATVRGRAMCSTSSQSVGTVGTPASSSGANCWCKITKVKDSSNKWLPLTSDWVSGSNSLPSVSNCNYSCASICAAAIDSQASEESPAGDALLNSANNRQYQCNANQIYITWEGVASDAKFGNTNANPDADGKATSTVTYGGDIIAPSKAESKSGMIFLGWKFREAQS